MIPLTITILGTPVAKARPRMRGDEISTMTRKKPNFGEIDCADCGRTVRKSGPVQKYCSECSEVRDRARKRNWAKEKYAANEGFRANELAGRRRDREKERKRKEEAGVAASLQESRSIAWYHDDGPHLHSLVRVSVPFTYKFSKNRIWSYAGDKGHVYRRREIKSAHDAMVWEIRRSAGAIRFVNAKVWLDILVQKPNHRGDAVNVIDFVCDAVKVAIDVDDRWFSIRRLDWEIVKDDPRLFIGIGQEAQSDHRVCSYCGRQLELNHFREGRRECASCRTAGRKAAA